MFVIADRDRCMGSGACAFECPEVFAQDEQGIVVLLTDNLDQSLRDAVLAADHLAKPGVREGLVELVPADRLGAPDEVVAPSSSSVPPMPASSPDMSSTSMADAPSCEVRIALGALLVPIDDQATAREVAGRS
jgi:ferredoxin